MALSNSERQAAHRAKQAAAVSDLAETVKKLLDENTLLRQQLQEVGARAEKIKADSEKKISTLKDKLLAALERQSS